MKPQIINYVLLAILLFSISSYSQKSNLDQTLNHSKSVTSFDLRSREVVGSNYINKEYLPAKIFDKEDVYSVRFDAYQDEMEVMNEDRARYLLKILKSKVQILGVDKLYQVYSYSINNNNMKGYFVVLYKGDNFSLLLKESIKLHEAVEPKTAYEDYVPPTFKRAKDKLYIGYKNYTTKELPKKKKDILAIFSSKAKEVEKYAKEQKLGFKKHEDLINIFKYFGSI